MLDPIIRLLPDVIGIVGVAIILTVYYLLNARKLKAEKMSFQVLNLIGSVLILFSLFFHWNTSSVIIEIAWITISLMGIQRVLKSRPKLKSEA